MNEAAFDEVSVLWAEHLGLPLSDDLRGDEIYSAPLSWRAHGAAPGVRLKHDLNRAKEKASSAGDHSRFSARNGHPAGDIGD